MRVSVPLLVLGASVLIATPGCDSTDADVSPPPTGPPTTGGTTPPSTGVFVPISPRSTYLRTEADPDALDPAIVALSDLGLSAGDAACFRVEGDYDMGSGVMASEGSVRVLAVFSRIKKTLDGAEPHRVPGAVDTGLRITTPPTAIGGLRTDIAEDFDAADACVRVPAEARFVVFSAWDSFFSDNHAKGPVTYGVRVRTAAP